MTLDAVLYRLSSVSKSQVHCRNGTTTIAIYGTKTAALVLITSLISVASGPFTPWLPQRAKTNRPKNMSGED